ncbi:MAG: hypothetical protein NC177_06965 [Ruminococcus flavefaciens]|nr:hypothetical protein [Ruminococcus flavefaciens]
MFLKKRYISVLAVLVLTACGRTEEIRDVQKPEQKLMFLITHDNYSEEEIHSASVITTDGKFLSVPDDILGEHGEMSDDWAEQLIQLSENTLVECTLLEDDLAVMYDFVNSADITAVPPDFKNYAEPSYDAGDYTLYLINDNYTRQKLCVSGQDNKYIDDDKVIDFCNFMNEKKYFNMYY